MSNEFIMGFYAGYLCAGSLLVFIIWMEYLRKAKLNESMFQKDKQL